MKQIALTFGLMVLASLAMSCGCVQCGSCSSTQPTPAAVTDGESSADTKIQAAPATTDTAQAAVGEVHSGG